MSKKVSLFIIFSIVIGLLGGCQLAKNGEKDGAGESQVGKNDKFIGVYISYMEDDSNIQVGSLAKYADENDKIYAKLVEVEGDDGIKSHEFVFGEGEGISFFEARIPERLTGEPDYISGAVSEEMIGSNVNIRIAAIEKENGKYEEEKTTVEMEGSLYFLDEVIVYANPVYQEADGDVYCLWGAIGEKISSQVSNASKTLGDEESTLVKLNIRCRSKVGDITFIALSNDSQIINVETYNANDVPENINIPEGTEYLLVKSEFGEEESELNIYTKEDVSIDIVRNGTGIAMVNHICHLIWSE